ncbi:hypothetical protein AGMMS50276_27600 [Synergistales bacterium]|nr:hypothetical protein AGMMS50276_27600 [Synergistales bacterium]
MSEEVKTAKREDDKIEWFGMDGFLCAFYVIEAIVMGYCFINNVDVVIGKVVPYLVTIVTTLIFLKYLFEVFSFAGSQGKR